ncbi:hypothetical protein quinque_004157 [Culex quinquefasciatus]
MIALALTLSVLFGGALSLLCPSQVDPSVTVNVAHPTTCAKYMSCVHTHPMEMYCPGGLEWNDHDSLCDYPGRSGCVRNVPEEVARLNGSALAAASVCLPQEASGCPLNSSPGEVALRKHRNCRMYYSCSLGKESPMYCPKGLYWNAGSCRCDYENSVVMLVKLLSLAILQARPDRRVLAALPLLEIPEVLIALVAQEVQEILEVREAPVEISPSRVEMVTAPSLLALEFVRCPLLL